MGDHDKGGLKMTDVIELNKALKLSYLNQLLNDNSPWTHLPTFYFKKLGGLNFILNCNYNIKKLSTRLPKFYSNILSYFAELKSTIINTAQDVASQIIWNNQHITMGGTSVFYKTWLEHGVKYVSDFFDEYGTPLSLHQFQEKYNFKVNYVTYNGMLLSIPKKWKELLKNENFNPIHERNDEGYLKILQISKGSTKEFSMNSMKNVSFSPLLTRRIFKTDICAKY